MGGYTARRPVFGIDEFGTYIAGPPLSDTCLQALSYMLLLYQAVQTRQSLRPFYHHPDSYWAFCLTLFQVKLAYLMTSSLPSNRNVLSSSL